MYHLRGSSPCPKCGLLMKEQMVKTTIWQGEKLIVVEDIPGRVCERCVEQYYNEFVTDALRFLVVEDLHSAKPKREMVVPVYSLEGRIKEPQEDLPPQADE